MSFLRKLFGRGAEAAQGAEAAAPTQEHKGFVIRATPFTEAGQFQLCGVITKAIDGTMREHRFIRADRFGDRDTAIEMTMAKARQIIDERGDKLFD